MRADQLESLGFLRRCGCHIAGRLDRYAAGLDRPAAGSLLFRDESPFAGVDVALGFSRVAKAVRQIVVLEQETAGVRPIAVKREAAAVPAPAAVASDRDALKAGEADATRPQRLVHEDAHDLPDAEDLHDRDDIDDYDDYAELRSGTLQDAIARISRDLNALPGAALVKQQMEERLAKVDLPEPAQPVVETLESEADTLAKSADAEPPRPKHGRDPP